jgi:hypothetical protein
MSIIKIKLALFLYTLLSIISLILAETHAECNARCYRENVACCDENPGKCGQICFDSARICYRACNNYLEFLQTVE